MKKFVSLILIFVVSAAMFSFVSHAENTPTLTVSSVSGHAGDNVAVTVDIANNSGIIAICFSIAYDSSILTLTDVTDGTIFNEGQSVFGNDLTANPYTVLWVDELTTANHTGNGTLVTFNFKIADDAPGGDTAITLTVNSSSTFDVDLNDVSFTAVNGRVTVPQTQESVMTNLPMGLTAATAETIIGTGEGEHLVLICNTAFLGTGSKVQVVENSSDFIIAEYTMIVYGDIDGDGLITVADQTTLKKVIAGNKTLDQYATEAADVNHDGLVDISDYNMLKLAIKGKVEIDQNYTPGQISESLVENSVKTGKLLMNASAQQDNTAADAEQESDWISGAVASLLAVLQRLFDIIVGHFGSLAV